MQKKIESNKRAGKIFYLIFHPAKKRALKRNCKRHAKSYTVIMLPAFHANFIPRSWNEKYHEVSQLMSQFTLRCFKS